MVGYAMQHIRPLTFNEKFAVVLLVLFFPVYLLGSVALNVQAGGEFFASLIWHGAWLIIALIAFCAAVATIFLKPDRHHSNFRMGLGRLLPVAALIIAVLLNSVVYDAFTKRQMQMFAKSHSEELVGPSPRAVVYREGIPDGGIAIVRSPGRNPEGFTQGVMIALTGERIKSCKPISSSDWSCHFD